MSQNDWRSFANDPPPPEASGNIEALSVNNALSEPVLYHYSDGRGSVWGFSIRAADKWRTAHPDYAMWRYKGPRVPTAQEQDRTILVWRWSDAPGELRMLSTHGGDEDWLALLPAHTDYVGWVEGDAFGCGDTSTHELPDGRLVKIGAHA